MVLCYSMIIQSISNTPADMLGAQNNMFWCILHLLNQYGNLLRYTQPPFQSAVKYVWM